MGEEKAALAKEYSEAKWKLGKAIAINTVVPALFMGVMLLSFEAALVLTVLYGVYKLYGMYGNYQKIRQPQSTEKSCFALSCG
jgi:hypothetical protein